MLCYTIADYAYNILEYFIKNVNHFKLKRLPKGPFIMLLLVLLLIPHLLHIHALPCFGQAQNKYT